MVVESDEKVQNTVVSIPTGSIKIITQCVTQCVIRKFQFQLVRLKYVRVVLANVTHWFQFQLVRLKFFRVNIAFKHFLFQFQLVRLKSAANLIQIRRKGVSIPTGSIKINFLNLLFVAFPSFNSNWFD